jgi:hypothetical protein
MKYRARTRHFVVLLLLAAAVLAALGWMRRVPERYFPAREVDRPAYPLRRVELPYPQGREGVDYYGTVRFDLLIDERGVVERVDVLEANVPTAYLDGSAQAFLETRFEPALKDGRKVRSVKRIEVRFAPPIRGLEETTPPSAR